jgi:transcriptional regulator with XRE-family HTH domain
MTETPVHTPTVVQPTRRNCPHCPRRALLVDGVLDEHWPPDADPTGPPCPGSGAPPQADQPDPVVAAVLARRHQLGLTQAQVAAAVGCTTYYLSQVERGVHPPSVRTLRVLCSALRLDLAVTPREDTPAGPDEVGRPNLRAENQALTRRNARPQPMCLPADVDLKTLLGRLRRAEAALARTEAAMDAMARQPHITHDLVDRARAAINTHHAQAAA